MATKRRKAGAKWDFKVSKPVKGMQTITHIPTSKKLRFAPEATSLETAIAVFKRKLGIK
jgi:hypothetical protein